MRASALRSDCGKGLLLAALCVVPAAYVRAAEAPPVEHPAAAEVIFSIPPGPLADALTAFAQQSRLQILFDTQLVAGRRSAGVSARLSASQALQTLLGDSGLAAVEVNANTYVLKASPAPPKPERKSARTAPRTADRDASAVELLPVQITGSHIRRTEWGLASPVTVITREDIERSGLTTLADVLRLQPGIEVAARPEVMASRPGDNYAYGGAAGASAVGMRGLGARATLVLVDGRRVAGYGLSQSGSGQLVDLNSIPLGLVERVEILRDGASAIYGADAIGGVVNVILRQSFKGRQVTVDYGISGHGDAQRRGFSATFGQDDGVTRVLLHADASERDPLVGWQRDWYTFDQRPLGLPDKRSPYSFPGNYVYMDDKQELVFKPLPGCDPRSIDENGLCVSDPAKSTSLQTGQTTRSVFLRMNRKVGDSFQLHADARVSTIDQKQQAAPTGATVVIPPGNAIGPDPSRLVLVLYSFDDVGPVRETTASTTHAFNVGADGIAGEWNWSTDLSWQTNAVTDYIDGFLKPSEALRVISAAGYQFGGPNSRDVIAAISPRLMRKGRTALSEFSANASGPAWSMPAGDAMIGIGMEARHLRVKDVPDPLLQSDDRLFGEASFIQRGSSNSAATYIEFELPLTRRLTAEAAWRYDHAQSVGSAVSPKFGLRWRWSERLMLRATAAEGYRAPTLLELNQPTRLATTETRVIPAALGPCADVSVAADEGDPTCNVRIVTSASPKGLKAETARSHTVGFVYSPLEDLNLAVDLYRIGRRDEIGAMPIEYALQNPGLFAGFLVRNKAGELVALNTYLVNLSRTETRGVDLAAQYRLGKQEKNSYVLRLDATYADRRDAQPQKNTPTVTFVGYDSNPRLRARLGLDWTGAPWLATASIVYVGPYRNQTFQGDTLGCAFAQASADLCHTPGFATLDLGAGYARGGWNVSFNIQNAFDRRPLYYGSNAASYNPLFDDPVGRYYSLTAGYRF